MKIIYNDGHVAECPVEDELEVLRHSAAHIMAQAVKRLYPDAHFAYGPATEKGFHYDIDLGDVKLTDEDLPAIEAEMKKIVKENLPFKVYPLPRDEAVQVKSISLTGDRTFMLQCEQMQLSAKIEPANAVNPFLTWTSSNGAVATVTQSGLVTSVGGGDAVITATAPNGVSVDYPLSVSSTQKWMRLSIRTARTESSRIGDEWAYSFEINGQDVTGEETLVVTLGETMSFYSAATEYLDNHDLGTVDGYYTVNKDGFTNGFEVTQEFEIDEKGKGADGGWAEVTVIFTFSNAI